MGEKNDKMNAWASDTDTLCLFIDKLFDSVDNSSTTLLPGKELKCAITFTSVHLKFCDEALKVLNSMEFSVNVPTFKKLDNYYHWGKIYFSKSFKWWFKIFF